LLSYRFQHSVVQSEIFVISSTKGDERYKPMMHTFRFQECSLSSLVQHFNDQQNSTLRVHLCTQGEVLGTAFVDLRQLLPMELLAEQCITFEGRMVANEYVIKSKKKDVNHAPRIAVRLSIDREVPPSVTNEPLYHKQLLETATPRCSSSTSCQTHTRMSKDTSTSPKEESDSKKTSLPKSKSNESLDIFHEKEKLINQREAELAEKEKDIFRSVAALEKKRCDFETWRHREELAFHEKLRDKEAALVRAAEQRETRKLSSVENSKHEYERLEARLKKALIEVESRERQLKDIELTFQNSEQRKTAELKSKEKLLKDELKHSVEIEQAKVKAAIEQAVAEKTAAEAANKRVQTLEAQIDSLRQEHRDTPEFTLRHQLAEAKGELADKERRIESIKAELSLVTNEKEQFRKNVHKLAKALRHEREKATKRLKDDQQINQQVRLSYDDTSKSFILGGGQHGEIQRILSDLSKISQIKGSSPHHPGPSPHPSHPSMNVSSTPRCHINLDGMMASNGYPCVPVFPDPIDLSP